MGDTGQLERKVDKLDERLDAVQIILAKQHESLSHHIYRTDLAERRQEHIEDMWDVLRAHLNRVEGMIMVAKIAGGFLATIATLLSIWMYLK